MFIDVEGSTRKSTHQSREEITHFIKEIKTLVEENIEKRNGNLVKTMGDGFLATFEAPTDAVICGIQIQKAVERRNINIFNRTKWVKLRIGINTGEVTIDDEGEIYGKAVNIAAKIQEIAQPHKVFISEATYLAINESEIKALNLEIKKIKGILRKVKLYKVLKGIEEKRLVKKESFEEKRASPLQKIGLLTLVILAGVVLMIVLGVIKKETLLNKFPFLDKIWKRAGFPCKVEGIIFSKEVPSVMVGGNTYFTGDYVCGGKIKAIHQDRIIAEIAGEERTYRVGEVIEEELEEVN
jgi:class 3 adenylate cyclase